MVYKLYNTNDLHTLPPINAQVKDLLHYHTQVLTNEYGAERGIDGDGGDGGYVLYLSPDGDFEEIQAYFDYTTNVAEYVERFDDVCVAMYLLNNEYCVTIIASLSSLPPELLKEIDDI